MCSSIKSSIKSIFFEQIMIFSNPGFDVSDAWRIRMSYQFIETLSDEAVERYQSADLFSPLSKLGQLSGCNVSWPRESIDCVSYSGPCNMVLFRPLWKKYDDSDDDMMVVRCAAVYGDWRAACRKAVKHGSWRQKTFDFL